MIVLISVAAFAVFLAIGFGAYRIGQRRPRAINKPSAARWPQKENEIMPLTLDLKTKETGVPFQDIPDGEWFLIDGRVCINPHGDAMPVDTEGLVIEINPDELVEPLDVKIKASPVKPARKPRKPKPTA